MSAHQQSARPADICAPTPLGRFERWLSVWVALCIAAGIALGAVAPGAFAALAQAEVAKVNLVVAVLIWVMIYPMMVNVDFGSLRRVGEASPTAAIIDSQSVKSAEKGGLRSTRTAMMAARRSRARSATSLSTRLV